MATSLLTENYGFGKYAPDDVTSYLTDYNGAMDKIDGAIKGVSDVANEAKATGDSNLNNIANLTQGLTATNKNVENMGKAQTAQQTEIDNIKQDLAKVVVGEKQTINLLASTQGATAVASVRNIGGVMTGYASFYLAEKTLNEYVAFGEKYFFEIAYVAGNPLNLTPGIKASGLCISASGTPTATFNATYETMAYYDEISNTTKYGVVGTGTTLEFKGGITLGMFL